MNVTPHTLTFPIWTEFGNGTVGRIGHVVESQDWSRALIVTDPGIRDAGLLDDATGSLDDAGIRWDIFDGVRPNPTVSMVEAATDTLETVGADVAIGIGGGSTMDVAKCATMAATNEGPLPDYEVTSAQEVMTGKITTDPLPLVTVPTTAGTGSEVDYWAVITDEDRDFKMALGQPPLVPNGPYLGAEIAIVDPELTVSLPPRQTAATGFDAFSHALENHVSKGCPTLVKPFTRHVLGAVPTYLPEAYDDGTLPAREQLMFASHIAGFCENFAGFGAIHSLAEVIGGMYPDIPHGEAIAAVTPAVMRYNLETVPGRYAEVAAAMGLAVDSLSRSEAAEAAVEAVEALIERVELPESLSELEVEEAQLPTIAENALETIEIHDNPRPADAADLLHIARDAY